MQLSGKNNNKKQTKKHTPQWNSVKSAQVGTKSFLSNDCQQLCDSSLAGMFQFQEKKAQWEQGSQSEGN